MTELRYTKQDVLDLNAEAWFKIMVEELKTLSAQFWNQRLSNDDRSRLQRAAELRNAGAVLVDADIRNVGEYDAPLVEDPFDPGRLVTIRHIERSR
jgi:hypothetical protein